MAAVGGNVAPPLMHPLSRALLRERRCALLPKHISRPGTDCRRDRCNHLPRLPCPSCSDSPPGLAKKTIGLLLSQVSCQGGNPLLFSLKMIRSNASMGRSLRFSRRRAVMPVGDDVVVNLTPLFSALIRAWASLFNLCSRTNHDRIADKICEVFNKCGNRVWLCVVLPSGWCGSRAPTACFWHPYFHWR
jgi:hypothetical protein